jgi:hypothetical protein
MEFVRQYKKISKKDHGPFSKERLEECWQDEINTLYVDEERMYLDRISHRDVLYIVHDNLKEHKMLREQRF